MGESVDVFISYAPADSEFCEQVVTHLALLQRQGVIRTWYDKKIIPGEIRDDVVAARIETARVVLLLISSAFVASDDCYRLEMERSLARHSRGEACVIPVIVRACDWKGAPFGHLAPLPRGAQAVTSWRNADEAWASVASDIRATITGLFNIGKKPIDRTYEEIESHHGTDTAITVPILPTSPKNKYLGRATALAGACIVGAAFTAFGFHECGTASPAVNEVHGQTYEVHGQLWHPKLQQPIVGAEVLFVGLHCEGKTTHTTAQGSFDLRCTIPPMTQLTKPRIRIKLPNNTDFCEPIEILSKDIISVIEIDQCGTASVSAANISPQSTTSYPSEEYIDEDELERNKKLLDALVEERAARDAPEEERAARQALEEERAARDAAKKARTLQDRLKKMWPHNNISEHR